MILYIVRHALAGSYGDPAWPDDFDRPFTDEGRRRFALMIRTLSERGLAPEVVATSPLVRCRQTAEILPAAVPGNPKVVELHELAPDGDLSGLLEWTAREAGHCGEVAWVGHAPSVGRLTAALIGDSPTGIRFAKGAVAAVRFDDMPAAAEGELRWLVTAKLLGC